MDDLKLERIKHHRQTILSNWDEIAQGLREGKSFNLEEFVPDNSFRTKKNENIIKAQEAKRKL